MTPGKPPSKARQKSKTKRARIHTDCEDAVGYGKPPRATQFKPGQSGNPRGRPKGRKSETTMLNELLFQKITIREGGRERRITLFEAMLRRFAEDSLKGNFKAAAFLFNRFGLARSDGSPEAELNDDDQAVLKAYAQELLLKNERDING
jgi:Family of unknown function (DUF5681)